MDQKVSKFSVSVVVPAFNEARLMTNTVQSLRKLKSPISEILIVIEKSTDGTLELASAAALGDPRIQVLAQASQVGKGFAVRTGMLAAHGDYVFFMDADLSTSLCDLETFIQYFDSHPEVDVLIGDRQHTGTKILKRQNLVREKMGSIFNSLVQAFVLKGIRDTQCGFKGFRRSAARTVFQIQTITGFAFDVEILLRARQENLKIVSLPVQWTNFGNSKVRMFRDSFRMARDVLRLKRHLHDSRTAPAAEAPRQTGT